eukprot:g7744.t1
MPTTWTHTTLETDYKYNNEDVDVLRYRPSAPVSQAEADTEIRRVLTAAFAATPSFRYTVVYHYKPSGAWVNAKGPWFYSAADIALPDPGAWYEMSDEAEQEKYAEVDERPTYSPAKAVELFREAQAEHTKRHLAACEKRREACEACGVPYKEVAMSKAVPEALLEDAKAYVQAHIQKLLGSEMRMFSGMLVPSSELKDVMDALPKQLRDWFKYDHPVFYKPVQELRDEDVGAAEVNMRRPMRAFRYQPYGSLSARTRNKAERFLKAYFRDLMCGGNDKQYEAVLNWLAAPVQGMRNRVGLRLLGPEGIGKSTLIDFLRYVLIGDACIVSGMRPLESDFNWSLRGAAIICFEEINSGNSMTEKKVDSQLKELLTSPTISFKREHCAPTDLMRNIANVICTSNFGSSVANDEGRRWLLIDFSDIRKGDHAFFQRLRRDYFTDEIGQAIHCYLKDRDLSTYDLGASAADMMTARKVRALCRKMPPSIMYIREAYLFEYNDDGDFLCKRSADMDVHATQLYEGFRSWCYGGEAKPAKRS